MASKNKQGKLIHIEVLRIMCIFLVMFNHTTPTGYLSFVGEENVVLYSLSMFASVLCKIAVPVFFMISGALLLGKEETLSDFLKKRVLRMVILLFVVSVPYYVLNDYGNGLSIAGFFAKIYTDNATTALWYLYSYIGFLVMLPVLRKLIKVLKDRDYKYIFLVHTVFSLVTAIVDCLFFDAGSVNQSISLSMLLEFNIFFPLMGYYVEHRIKDHRNSVKTRNIAICAAIASIIITCIITQIYVLRNDLGDDYKLYESFFNCLIAVPAISVYFITKGITKIKTDSFFEKTVSQMGGAVFGVYLIEKILRIISSPVYDILDPHIGPFFATIAWVVVGIIFGLVMVCLFRNIPFIGKHIRKWI